jgi:hypothetical protein
LWGSLLLQTIRWFQDASQSDINISIARELRKGQESLTNSLFVLSWGSTSWVLIAENRYRTNGRITQGEWSGTSEKTMAFTNIGMAVPSA